MRYGRERLVPAALGQEIFDGRAFVGMVGRVCESPRAPRLHKRTVPRPMERVVGDLFRGMSRQTFVDN
jgi:hypothetical protein